MIINHISIFRQENRLAEHNIVILKQKYHTKLTQHNISTGKVITITHGGLV